MVRRDLAALMTTSIYAVVLMVTGCASTPPPTNSGASEAFSAALSCPKGQVSVDGEACCWPGERWSSEERRCSGTAQCPEGTRNDEGAGCVPVEPYGWYREDCDGGAWSSCAELGWLYFTGEGVEADAPRGTELFEASCSNGALSGCLGLALAMIDGDGVEEDFAGGLEILERLCEEGRRQDATTAYSCAMTGYIYLRGESVEADLDRARHMLILGCEGGLAWSCAHAGVAHFMPGQYDENVPELAEEYLGLACGEGLTMACYNLAVLHESVRSSYDPQRAGELYELACTEGIEQACDSQVVLERNLENIRHARDRCEAGESSYCSDLASRYADGRGVPIDEELAMEWYERACDDEHAPACNRLGVLFVFHGEEDRGLSFMERGCQLGDQPSCESLEAHR